MNSDIGPTLLGVFAVVVLACIGVFMLTGDYRHFDTITQHCKTQGYVQNTTTRITCTVEEPKQPEAPVAKKK